MSSMNFRPEITLMQGTAHENCRAVVILPARNEETCLAATLDALAAQVALTGARIPADAMETLLLLNNCTDDSAAVVRQWQARHPGFILHLLECILPGEVAHVGTARRLLMDTAWSRLAGRTASAILSTDADTLVAPDWVAQNLRAIENGADAVGGVIDLMDGDLDSLPSGARDAYLRDRKYQRLVAELESWLDPQEGDPWPRHLEHFGASLACTPQIYARAGGLPPVKPLEDVAFVNALRRVGARLRHDPAVVVKTSARLDGRAEVGLSGQLRIWQDMSESSQPHVVRSCEWLTHRFECLGRLRKVCRSAETEELESLPAAWHSHLLRARGEVLSVSEFLGVIDSEGLIGESYRGESDALISLTIEKLEETLKEVRGTAGAADFTVSDEEESRAA